jgi:NADP-dependent 3-hydroxy acid dehydrogenase YdfG
MAMSDRPLSGRIAVVTGAGSGLGAATARRLAEAGARAVLVGRRAGQLEEVAAAIVAAGGEARAMPCDLAVPADVVSLFAAVRAELGPVDILVNNAGSAPPIKNLLWMPDDQWDDTIAVNLTAVYAAVKAVLPDMLDRGEGTIITVSSLAAVRPNLLGGAPYGAAKAAVGNFMGYLRATYRHQGLRATTILPGEMDTPILDTRARPPTAEERARMIDPDAVAQVILLCCTLPAGTTVEEVPISPTFPRDQGPDIEISRHFGRPSTSET